MITFTASIVFAALAFAGGASAEGAHVPVIGKSPAALHSEFVQAARQVCGDAAFDLSRLASQDACVAQAVVQAKSILTGPSDLASGNGR